MAARKQPQSLFWFCVSACALIATLCAISAYTLYGFLHNWMFSWANFAGLVVLAELMNGLFLLSAWKVHKRFRASAQVAILDWSGLSIWFFLLGPLYQFVSVMMNSSQIQLDAFVFFWEVPVIGLVAIAYGQWYFRPVARYLASGHTAEPEKLARRLDAIPINVATRALVFTVAGYALGALQFHIFAGMSPIESWKNVGNGIVMSLLLSLFYGLIFSRYLGPIVTMLRDQYHLPLRRQVFSRGVVFTTTLVIMSSICMLVLLFVQAFQMVIQRHLTDITTASISAAVADRANAGSVPDVSRVDDVILGRRGAVWEKSAATVLPVSDVSAETRAAYAVQANGSILDLQHDIKLIIFQTDGATKIGSVIYLSEFYGALEQAIVLIIVVAFIIGCFGIAAITVFNQILGRSVRQLSAAVDEAQRTGIYHRPDITSADEFQGLSESFAAFIGQAHDRTEQLTQERARLEASIEALGQGFVMTDHAGEIIAHNSAVTAVLGSKAGQAKNMVGLAKSLSAEDAKRLATTAKATLGGFSAKQVWELTTNENKILRIYLAPVEDRGNVLGVVLLINDVTEEKVAARSRDEFFSIASHELRTPLTAIRGNSSMISGMYADAIKSPDVKEMVHDIHESSVRLIEIVNDFLDLSRLEQGRMKYHPQDFHLAEIVGEVTQEMNAVVAKRNLYLKLDSPELAAKAAVHADRDRVKQVLYNLVGNALKFTETGGITVKFVTVGKQLEVQVRDTGVGISPEEQNLLFRKFQQASSSLMTRNASGGTGLGLYISKRLVADMGGLLKLSWSREGKGTEFSFTLPLAKDKPSTV